MATGYFASPITTTTSGTGYTITFYDIDGRILKTEIVASGGTATAPTANYDPTYLTFYEWNNNYNNITEDVDIGAIYQTVSGYTYYKIGISATGTTLNVYFNKGTASLVTIIWGDGSTNYTGSTSGWYSPSHTYNTSGSFIITIINTSGTFGVGGQNIAQSFIQPATLVDKAYFGIGTTFKQYACYKSQASVMSIPPGLTQFGITDVFNGAYGPTHMNFPRSFTTFQILSFYLFYGLKNLIFYNGNVISVDSQSFQGAYSLKKLNKIILAGSSSNFRNCYSLEKISSLASVGTSIGANTFDTCWNLKTITIPSNVTSIGVLAFNACYSMREYIFQTSTPPTISSNTFTGISTSCKIYVPDANVNDYKTATNWVTYANLIYSINIRP